MCRHPDFTSYLVVDIDLGREGVQMLKKRDQGGMGEEIGEDELLALILKEDAMKGKNNCEEKLSEYCENLEKAGLKPENIHEKLGKYCKDKQTKEKKCAGLKENIEKECQKLQKKIEDELNHLLTEKNYTRYQGQCHFLEGACTEELTRDCSSLRNAYYRIKHDNVAIEILMRALPGMLKNGDEAKCEAGLKEVCKVLAPMSHELMRFCLDSDKTCESLKKAAEEKCKSLEEKLEKEVKDDKDVKKDTCLPLLEECYFYGPNCEESKTKCNQLKKKCDEDYDILYTPPEEPWFPIQPRVSIIEKVGLEGLYKAIAQKGILINEPQHPSMEDLIFFLSQKDNGKFNEEECKNAHKEEQCNYLKTLSKNSNYECSKMKDECRQLEAKFKNRREALKENIKNVRLFDGNKGTDEAKTIPWHELNSDIYGRNCADLQSDCFFLSRYKNDLTTACDNVQAMCYRRGLDAAAYETLEDQMRGEFRDSGQNWFKNGLNQCQKKLVEVCKGVRNQSYHLLGLCLEPKETCSSLSDDILDKTYELNRILDFARDSPQEHDCLKLEPKCNRLKEEDTELLGPCYTLEKNCLHLRESQQLRDLLLGEKKNLSDITHCGDEINDKCHHYSRKLYKQFKLSCALQNNTCKMISFYIKKYCSNLIRNINESDIVTKLDKAKNKIDELRELCPRWMPYCNVLLPSCADKLAKEEDNETLCPKIQEICQPYQERQAVEDAVLYKFQGHLENESKCNSTLEEHCVRWTQENNTFSSLCNDTNGSNKNDRQVREDLCKRLVKKVRRWCKTLPKELEEAKKELKQQLNDYDDLKNKAENATKGTNVILTFNIKNNSTDKTNNSTGKTNNSTSHVLVKRSESQPPITVLEAQAFDLVAMTVDLYLDLKEKCRKLLLDCGFKVECEGSQDPCKEIEKKCGELEPLKMRPPEVTTSTTTITQNVTLNSEGKPICTSGAPSISMNCTSIHTTDTWVTHTSTHTSTMTKTSTVTSKVTIISTKKCQPTQCTTDRTHPTHGSGGEEAGEVKPSGGIRVNGWGTNGMILMILFSMIYF